MTRWDETGTLIDVVDRHFAYLFELSGISLLIRLGRVLNVLSRDPRTIEVLTEMRLEAERILEVHERADTRAREGLKKTWVERRNADPHFFAGSSEFGGLIDAALQDPEPFDLGYGELHDRHVATLDLVDVLIRDCGAPLEGSGQYRLVASLRQLRARLEYRARRLQTISKGLPWAAYLRLVEAVGFHNPAPPRGSDPMEWEEFEESRRLASSLEVAEGGGVDVEIDAEALTETVKSDARLLQEEVRFRLGLVRSNLTLVQRYAARCEAFEAADLRQRCDANSANAERLLTLSLARYLFDAGVAPLVDGTIGGLRPDLVHLQKGTLFYVEAKQYAHEHPRWLLRQAYRQVWSTWGHLRKLAAVPEAFLVVFRRSGPWVELPDVIVHDGLRLYSVVADISENAGSRETRDPIKLTVDELLPNASDETPDHGE